MRTVGFYNNKVDRIELLNECEVIVNSFSELKSNIKKNDKILLASDLSLFDVGIIEMLSLQRELNLNISIVAEEYLSESNNNFQINMILVINNYIKENRERIKKLL